MRKCYVITLMNAREMRLVAKRAYEAETDMPYNETALYAACDAVIKQVALIVRGWTVQ